MRGVASGRESTRTKNTHTMQNYTREQKRYNVGLITLGLFKFEDRTLVMDYFCKSDSRESLKPSQAASCGTAGCFAGIGPLVGIDPLPEEMWFPYVNRVFTTLVQSDDGTIDDSEFDFLFDAVWPDIKLDTARRALYYLENGIPKEWNYRFLPFQDLDQAAITKRVTSIMAGILATAPLAPETEAR